MTEFTKKCEEIKKTLEGTLAIMKDVERMMEELAVKFVEEETEDEIIIDMKYLKDANDMMVIDLGAPVSLVSSNWLENYMRNMRIDDGEVERSRDNRRFRLGKTLYMSEEKIKFPVLMRTDGNDFIKEDVTENVINLDEVTFL